MLAHQGPSSLTVARRPHQAQVLTTLAPNMIYSIELNVAAGVARAFVDAAQGRYRGAHPPTFVRVAHESVGWVYDPQATP